MYVARLDLTTAAALHTAVLLIPKSIAQRHFWLSNSLEVGVVLWSPGIAMTPSCSWCVWVEQIFVLVPPV